MKTLCLILMLISTPTYNEEANYKKDKKLFEIKKFEAITIESFGIK